MNLFVFNPEHDIALASGLRSFTAPHAGRQLRHDLGFLPMIWAEEGDAVLVDDIELAHQSMQALGLDIKGLWVTPKTISHYLKQQPDDLKIVPWGWDAPIATELSRMGCPKQSLPDDDQLRMIRQMSHRQWANIHLLSPLSHMPGLIGQAHAATSIGEVEEAIAALKTIVVKAPWSSSGRGVRTISSPLASGMRGWIGHVIERQRCIMVEPYYQKVIDLGMEFQLNGDGSAHYEGLSLFDTANGAYTGNRIDSEEDKEAILFQYISPALWHSVKTALTALLHQHLAHYRGRLGIDMMVVSTDDGLRLHPCVEMNLRSTMGHVALQLHRRYGLHHQSMQITYDGRYHLFIK